MHNVKVRLDAWRDAEHRRDGLALGSPERREAEEEVRRARTVFHAEVAQVSARYVEAEFQDRHSWSGQLDRRTAGAGGDETAPRHSPWVPLMPVHDR